MTDIPTTNVAPDIRVLNIVVATPDDREGAVRAGLQLGDHLSEFVAVDTVKMRGKHDYELATELDLDHSFHLLPSHLFLRNVTKLIAGSPKNYSNTLIWTRLQSPQPLKKYDIAHIHNAVPLAGMVAVAVECKLSGIPYCVTTHGISKIPKLTETMEMPWYARAAFRLGFFVPYKAVLENATHLFALSEVNAETLRNRFPQQSVSIVPNGVPLNPPKQGIDKRVKEELGISSSTPILLFVGKIISGKGIDDLLAAHRRLDEEYELVIVGDPMDERLVERVSLADVHYLGYVEKPFLRSIYQRSDIFIFPTRSDVFPLVTLEAMASATPVISTKVGGIPNQATKEMSKLVEPGDIKSLTEAICELLNDHELRNEMSRAALERARSEYTWRGVAEKTIKTYREILTTQNK